MLGSLQRPDGSELDVSVLERLVASVTGIAYDPLAKLTVIEPIGLSATGLLTDATAAVGLARGYAGTRELDGGSEPTIRFFSTVHDLEKRDAVRRKSDRDRPFDGPLASYATRPSVSSAACTAIRRRSFGRSTLR